MALTIKCNVFIISMFMIVSCNYKGTKEQSDLKNPFFNIDSPSEINYLEKKLVEISALTYADNDTLYCIEDEKGKLYKYSFNKNKVVDKIDFGHKGDYEGVELANNKAYIITSNNKLTEYDLATKEVNHYKLKFDSKKYDIEGLGFDSAKNRLLIACKENPENNKTALVFGFDLKTYQLIDEPIYQISSKKIRKIIHANKRYRFKPSGITIDVVTNEVYVLSSAAKTLVVLDKNTGKIKYVNVLPPKIFKQAEGITFDRKGDLYISNEGQKGKASILKFYRIKK